MGMYMYVTEHEVKMLSSVQDEDVNELLQEARRYDDRLLIAENYRYDKKNGLVGFFFGGKIKTFEYTLFIESRAHDGSPYQAQYITSAGSSKKSIITFLYGFINGAISQKKVAL